MKELVEVIAKALVENPDEVVVTQKEEGRILPWNSMWRPPIWARSSANRDALLRQSALLSRRHHRRIIREWTWRSFDEIAS